MPRPKLPKSEKLTTWSFVRLRIAEKRALEALSRTRRRLKAKNWSASAILREGFLLLLERQK